MTTLKKSQERSLKRVHKALDPFKQYGEKPHLRNINKWIDGRIYMVVIVNKDSILNDKRAVVSIGPRGGLEIVSAHWGFEDITTHIKKMVK